MEENRPLHQLSHYTAILSFLSLVNQSISALEKLCLHLHFHDKGFRSYCVCLHTSYKKARHVV